MLHFGYSDLGRIQARFADPSRLQVFTLAGGKKEVIRPQLIRHGSEQVWETGTKTGDVLLWTDDPCDNGDVFPAFDPAVPNAAMKTCGKAELGSPAVLK